MKSIILSIALLLAASILNAQNNFPATGSATLSGVNVGLHLQNTSESQWSGSALSFNNNQTALGSTIWFKHEKTSQGPLVGTSNFIWRYSEPSVGYINMIYFNESSKNIFFNHSKTHSGSYGNVIVSNGAFSVPNGRMGIGTSNPQAPLEIVGPNSDLFVALRLRNTDGSGSYKTSVGIDFHHFNSALEPNARIYEQEGPSTGNYGGSLFFATRSSGSSVESTSVLNRMVVRYDGFVGIGTDNPQSLLSVKGKITAQEVEVTLSGWSDFVFESTYKLRPLSEVESFIKTNGHLPEIPSAKEVENNGVNLGEMDKLLLQKIEELTLYMIEMKKENQELKQEIEKLKENKK